MTWRDILKYCCGECGLRPDEFWSMTFEEVDLWCRGYEIRMAKLKEVPRLIAAILINVNRKSHTAPVSLEKVFPLYTDSLITIKLMSKEEFEQAKEIKSRVIKWQNRN